MIQLEHTFEGPFNSSCYDVKFSNDKVFRVDGKRASLISLILSGYQLRDDFHPMDAFDRLKVSDDKKSVEAVGEVPSP